MGRGTPQVRVGDRHVLGIHLVKSSHIIKVAANQLGKCTLDITLNKTMDFLLIIKLTLGAAAHHKCSPILDIISNRPKHKLQWVTAYFRMPPEAVNSVVQWVRLDTTSSSQPTRCCNESQ